MDFSVKLINGFWMADINGKLEKYTELPPTLKKMYTIALQCEIIVSKFKNNNQNLK
jgi:hypothetical protein